MLLYADVADNSSESRYALLSLLDKIFKIVITLYFNCQFEGQDVKCLSRLFIKLCIFVSKYNASCMTNCAIHGNINTGAYWQRIQ